MMLSINIPVYNIDVRNLASQLINQAGALGVDFEIRIYDDGSTEDIKLVNSKMADTPGVIYREMKNNLGRAAIRNKMGIDSEKTYQLFIDADSRLISDSFLKNYLDMAFPRCVLCGGTYYNKKKPSDPKKLLRWVYGSKREAISAQERNSKKGFIITSNNFLIDKQVFNDIPFRENIGSYGHEDTLLGYDLFSEGIMPLHIDNPVEHTGLEDSVTFLNKTCEALRNLRSVSQTVGGSKSEFSRRVNFLKQYKKITAIVPPIILRLFFNLFKGLLEKNLTGKNPGLFCLDTYKVGYYANLH